VPVWLLGLLVGSLAAYRAFTFILTPPLGGASYWIIGFAYAAALWVIVAVGSFAQGEYLSRQLRRRRVA
jgi:hypothetical protein